MLNVRRHAIGIDYGSPEEAARAGQDEWKSLAFQRATMTGDFSAQPVNWIRNSFMFRAQRLPPDAIDALLAGIVALPDGLTYAELHEFCVAKATAAAERKAEDEAFAARESDPERLKQLRRRARRLGFGLRRNPHSRYYGWVLGNEHMCTTLDEVERTLTEHEAGERRQWPPS